MQFLNTVGSIPEFVPKDGEKTARIADHHHVITASGHRAAALAGWGGRKHEWFLPAARVAAAPIKR